MAETSADRVVRLLALVAYLDDHRGVSVAQVAQHFGVSEAQVLKDVDTLWVSGVPGYQHGDLIDFAADDHERNILTLVEPQGMDRPLRLGPGEAVALLVALRSLAAAAGSAEVVGGVLDKLTAAAGSAAAAAQSIEVHSEADQTGEYVELIRSALDSGRQLQLRYVSSGDQVTERVVDPLQLLTDSQVYFLHAWCHRAGDIRQFRADRILSAQLLDSNAVEHPGVVLPDSPDPQLSGAHRRVTLELSSRARWVAERYPVAAVRELGDSGFAVDLDVVDPAWLRNLVMAIGPDLRSVQPADLATELAQYARAGLDAYAQVPAGDQ